MTSFISRSIAREILKQAGYAATAKSRNYTPPKPKMPVVKEEETGLYKYRSDGNWGKGNPIVTWGKNTSDWSGYMPMTEDRLLDYRNTISGTGHGRPYWEEKQNPFES